MDNSRDCYTVPDFCQSHAISRSTFYELQQQGVGPAIAKIGRRTLITRESAEAWRRSLMLRTSQSASGAEG